MECCTCVLRIYFLVWTNLGDQTLHSNELKSYTRQRKCMFTKSASTIALAKGMSSSEKNRLRGCTRLSL